MLLAVANWNPYKEGVSDFLNVRKSQAKLLAAVSGQICEDFLNVTLEDKWQCYQQGGGTSKASLTPGTPANMMKKSTIKAARFQISKEEI